MAFTTPLAFVLLIIIPLVLYIGWPRQRFRRNRDIISLALRLTIVLLLVLSLAGVQVVRSADKLAVIFLVDASDSVGQIAMDNALNQVEVALRSMGTADEAGVIVFGGDAHVERVVNNVRELGTLRSNVNTSNTDLAGAIRLALALFPADAARRIVIFSDGYPTLGNSEAAAELANASGVQISYVQIERATRAEVRVTEFTAPSTVQEGQQFDLAISIDSNVETEAQIVVFTGGEEIVRETTQLRRGENNRTLTLTATQSGFRDFRVVVEVPQSVSDGFYQNNSLATFSQVVGPSQVLLIGASEADTRYILPALQEAGLNVESGTPRSLPTGVAELAKYESVILVNVPATQLSDRRMQVLQTYVRDLGGGLVVVGGENTYGPGGYFQTPLEDTLPVEMQIKDQQRLPKLTIAYVIDRSGSMGFVGPDGTPMIELAKEAINRSIDLLNPTDRAAVVSFDALAYWIAEFQDVRDKQALQRRVGTLTPSGGTDILSGMNLVARDIVNEPSELKHIILLTDGIADSSGLVEVTRDLYENHNVTTTTIAIGAPSPLLEEMADAGEGNYHIAVDLSTIPTIFSQETVLATRSYVFEEAFVPLLSARSPIMDGITALPPLLGYIGVTPKSAAQVILRAPNQFSDPILASWQYGLGRSVAFMSDATARWGVNWVLWDEFSRFWSQTVRWTITESGNQTIETRVVMEGGQARVIVDARDENGAFLNGLNLQTSVVDPMFGNQRLQLRQVAPGRYEAVFKPDEEGVYLLRVTGTGTSSQGSEIAINQTNGWVMSYSLEYLTTANTESVLPTLASITGGRSLAADITAAFDRNVISRDALTPLAPTLLLLALLLLPVDIAVRRLVITRTDVVRLRQAVAQRLKRPKRAAPSIERVTALIDVRNRVRQQQDSDKTASTTAPSASTISALRSRRETNKPTEPTPINIPTESAVHDPEPVLTPSSAVPPSRPAPSAAPKPSAPPPKPSEGGSLGSKLLQKRREQRTDGDS